jgi:hypothetical protein
MFETSGATAVSSNENKGEEIQVRTDTKRQMQHTGRNGRSGVSIPNAQGRRTRAGEESLPVTGWPIQTNFLSPRGRPLTPSKIHMLQLPNMGNKASKKKKAEAEAAKKKQQNKSTSGGSNGNTNNKSTNPEKKEPRPSMVSQKKVSLEDFVLLTTVGKGSFGKVIQVRKKDSGQIYAMKVLKKAQVIRRKQYEHTMTERHILEEVKIYIFFRNKMDRSCVSTVSKELPF